MDRLIKLLSQKAGNCLMGSLCKYLFICLLAWGLVSCNGELAKSTLSQERSDTPIMKQGKITEVSPPAVIQQLRVDLDSLYQPQVSIVTPQKDDILKDSTVSVGIEVRNFTIFRNEEFGLGPHLEMVVDNGIKRSIYSIKDPIVLENLAPGTHTLRVFAVAPWGESFKNVGSYAETTFHLYSKTGENAPDLKEPLLTFNQPQGAYSGEPVLLDFYLTNAPLHLVAGQSEEDTIENWRIKVTVNGEVFYLDRWDPIYLMGFSKGKNWIQLEYINEKGVAINNDFNNTVRVIDFQGSEDDSLSRLMRNEIPFVEARAIIDPNYQKPRPALEENQNVEQAEPSDEIITPETSEKEFSEPAVELPEEETSKSQDSLEPAVELPEEDTPKPQESPKTSSRLFFS